MGSVLFGVPRTSLVSVRLPRLWARVWSLGGGYYFVSNFDTFDGGQVVIVFFFKKYLF